MQFGSYNKVMKNNKWFFTISSIIFTVIAIAHLARIIWMLPATYGMYEIPLWFSGAAVMLMGYLATRGFMEAHKL